MKFLLVIFLVGTPSLIHGFEDDWGDLPMEENKIIEPSAVFGDPTLCTSCGGVIPLSPIFYSRIEYKWGKLLDPNEFCVWTLLPGDHVTSVSVDVTQNMADPNFVGITVYFLNSTGITSMKLPGNYTNFNFNTPLAFLVFNSDGATHSNGFRISMGSTGDSGTTSAAAYHVRKDEGEFSYPMRDPKRNRDKAMEYCFLNVALASNNATRGDWKVSSFGQKGCSVFYEILLIKSLVISDIDRKNV